MEYQKQKQKKKTSFNLSKREDLESRRVEQWCRNMENKLTTLDCFLKFLRFINISYKQLQSCAFPIKALQDIYPWMIIYESYPFVTLKLSKMEK